MNSNRAFFWAAVSSLSAWLCVATAGDDASQVQRIVDDWMQRRKNASSVSYHVQGPQTIFQGTLDGGWPNQDSTHEKKVSWLIQFEKNWVKKETSDYKFLFRENKFIPTYQMELFDGKDAVTLQPREKNTGEGFAPSKLQPDVLLTEPSHADVFLEPYFDAPILFAHGIVATLDYEPTATNLLGPLKTTDFAFYGRAVHEGISCVILRTPIDKYTSFHEYWVDTARGSAIVRYQVFFKEKCGGQVDIRWQSTDVGWLPASWRWNDFDSQEKLKRITEVSVTEFKMNPAVTIESFQYKLEPGRIVDKVAQSKLYRVRSDGSLEDLVVGDLQTGRPLWLWGVGALAVVGLLVLVPAIRRRFMRSRLS